MEPILDSLMSAAAKAGPFAAVLALTWGFSQYRRAEQERKERIALQELLHGKDGVAGLIERTVRGLNDATTAITSMNDTVRPLVNAVIEKVAGK